MVLCVKVFYMCYGGSIVVQCVMVVLQWFYVLWWFYSGSMCYGGSIGVLCVMVVL